MFLEHLHKISMEILINGSTRIEILSFCFIYKVYRGDKLHINLNTVTRIEHLLTGGNLFWIGRLQGEKIMPAEETV